MDFGDFASDGGGGGCCSAGGCSCGAM
jgi:hypothetical protein